MREDRSPGGRWLTAALALALLPSCFDSHALPIDGERVRVEQPRLTSSRGFLEPMPPEDATVVAWSCDGTWSAESGVDANGHAVFHPPEGLDCWNLTAVDLHFSVGGGAGTVLHAPIPFEGAILLPAGFRDPADAIRDMLELSGRVVGLPDGTDAVEITSNARLFPTSTEVVGSEAHFVRGVGPMPPGEPLHITVLAMGDGFPIHGVEADLAIPASGDLSVELALPETPARIEQADFTMRVPDEAGHLAGGPFAQDGTVHLEGRPGGTVGRIRLDPGEGSEWTGEARWVAFTEGAAILSPAFGWSTGSIERSEEEGFTITTLRARGSATALSALTIPEIPDQRATVTVTPDGSRSRLEASIGHEDLVPRLILRTTSPDPGSPANRRAWWIEGFGPGRIALEDWPRLPSDVVPEEVMGSDDPTHIADFFTLRTPHEAGPDDPASFRIMAPQFFAGLGTGTM